MESAGRSGASSQSPSGGWQVWGAARTCVASPQLRRKALGEQVRWAGVQGEGLAGCLRGSRGGVLRGAEGTESGRKAGQRPSGRASRTATRIVQAARSLSTRPPWTLTTGSPQSWDPSPK